ncbi:hypothetical protein MVEN_01759600 [Mycena venus]|uniref:Deoxyribonuclease NucA/NucB domain-containing protein n=1 Tax=Mycena venus TaxID=2733690 RepID=A0A8H6XKG9_9AGAR|nr:hypothetical protein MVEN_01759600 [Mycena venus]
MIFRIHHRRPLSSLALLFLLTSCRAQWDEPSLAVSSEVSHEAIGLTVNNNSSLSAAALVLSSSIAPLLGPGVLQSRDEEECVDPGYILCAALVPRRAAVSLGLFVVEANAVPQVRHVMTAYAAVGSIFILLSLLTPGLAAEPTLEFPYLKGHNDELIKNICEGMGGSNTDTLTYSGSMTKQAKQDKRIAQGKLYRWILRYKEYRIVLRRGLIPYPFASTDEGGGKRTSGVVLCVPAHQNDWQGQLMRGWVNALKKTGFSAGDKFNVKVTGVDCSNFKRDAETITTMGQGSMLWPPFAFDTTNQSFITVSLGDIPAGSYSLRINLTSGSVTSAYLVDNEGEELVNITTLPTPGKPMQLSFSLDYSAVGVGLALFTTDAKTNITYTADETPSISAAPSSTTPTKSNARVVRVGIPQLWLGLCSIAYAALLAA